MKKNCYLIYLNLNELYESLIHNAVFPVAKDGSSLSLSKPGYVYLTKKRFGKELIFERCRSGVYQPVILEVAVNLAHEKEAVVISEDDFLVSSPISLNAVNRIFYLDGKLSLSLFDDAYLFRSLLSESDFEYGSASLPDFSGIPDQESNRELLKRWDKLQAYFACRYRSGSSELRLGKGRMLYSNLDEDLAIELLGQTQKDFFIAEFGRREMRMFFAEEAKAVPCPLADFMDANHEALLVGKRLKGGEEKILSQRLYSACMGYEKGGSLLSAIDASDLVVSTLIESAQEFEKNYGDDIFESKTRLFAKEASSLRFLCLLSRIVGKRYDDAVNYLSNFPLLSNKERRCLLALYGLSVGMGGLSISIKKSRPDLLLFAFNRAKKHFKRYVDNAIPARDYLEKRQVFIDHLVKDGFNYIAYHRDAELRYLNAYARGIIQKETGLSDKSITKKIVGFVSEDELHKAFLKLKKGK